MACEHEQQPRESGLPRLSPRGEAGGEAGRPRLLHIMEETRSEAGEILRKYGKELPRDLSNREILLISLGIRLARLKALPNEVRGVGHLVHLPQIRQDAFDLGLLLSRLSGKQRPKSNE